MLCKKCDNQMKLDDTNYNFPGNIDYYWICENCNCSCKEQIRYGQKFKENWTINDKNYTVKYKIDTSVRIKRGNYE